MKYFGLFSSILALALLSSCGASDPDPVELCSPPPPEDCAYDVETFPSYDGIDGLIIKDARDLEPFCERGCTRFNGSLYFQIRSGPPPDSLSPLSNLTELVGIFASNGDYGASDFRGLENLEKMRNLSIFDESALESLKGLESLNEVGLISLENVPNLRSLDGLNNLERINERAYYDENAGVKTFIRRADRLEDLSGLDSLTDIDGTLWLEDNRGLNSFKGVESLRNAGQLVVTGNPQLASLDGLDNVETAQQLAFEKNPKLPSCKVEELIERVELNPNERLEEQYWIINDENSSECPVE